MLSPFLLLGAFRVPSHGKESRRPTARRERGTTARHTYILPLSFTHAPAKGAQYLRNGTAGLKRRDSQGRHIKINRQRNPINSNYLWQFLLPLLCLVTKPEDSLAWQANKMSLILFALIVIILPYYLVLSIFRPRFCLRHPLFQFR